MQHKNYITRQGYEVLKEELHTLVTVDRPQTTQIITWAAGNGDRSENGDYIYGKRKLREIDKRIHILTKKLEQAEVVDYKAHVGSEKIFFGATVTILRSNDVEQTIKIVGQDEIDPTLNHISWTAPIARLLIGKTISDILKLRLGDNEELIEILDVSYI
jgi:transcription elongation factor GreB